MKTEPLIPGQHRISPHDKGMLQLELVRRDGEAITVLGNDSRGLEALAFKLINTSAETRDYRMRHAKRI